MVTIESKIEKLQWERVSAILRQSVFVKESKRGSYSEDAGECVEKRGREVVFVSSFIYSAFEAKKFLSVSLSLSLSLCVGNTIFFSVEKTQINLTIGVTINLVKKKSNNKEYSNATCANCSSIPGKFSIVA